MPPKSAVEVYFTPEFKRNLRVLAKKYPHIRSDIQPIIEQIAHGNFIRKSEEFLLSFLNSVSHSLSMKTQGFVICVDNSEYPASLELHKIYRVIADKIAQADGDMRIVDESGEDYLFPADYFIPIPLPQTILRALNKSFARTSAKT